MLGSPILYLKGWRILMFQLSGFYYRINQGWVLRFSGFLVLGLGFWVRALGFGILGLDPKP